MLLGEVDRVDDHFVATKFHALLLPAGSMYVMHQDASRQHNVTTLTASGVNIQFHWKSAVLGIARVWPWFLAAAWPFAFHYGQSVSAVSNSTWATMTGFVFVALLAHWPGRLSEAEKHRLRILGRISGLRIDPAKLQPISRIFQRDNLEAKLATLGVRVDPEGVLAAANGASPDALDVLYTYACYAGDSREWREVANKILTRYARGS
jgi:hypothetical protein